MNGTFETTTDTLIAELRTAGQALWDCEAKHVAAQIEWRNYRDTMNKRSSKQRAELDRLGTIVAQLQNECGELNHEYHTKAAAVVADFKANR